MICARNRKMSVLVCAYVRVGICRNVYHIRVYISIYCTIIDFEITQSFIYLCSLWSSLCLINFHLCEIVLTVSLFPLLFFICFHTEARIHYTCRMHVYMFLCLFVCLFACVCFGSFAWRYFVPCKNCDEARMCPGWVTKEQATNAIMHPFAWTKLWTLVRARPIKMIITRGYECDEVLILIGHQLKCLQSTGPFMRQNS